ncbi:Serine/threonine-protein kinase 17A, partial [Paragonimus heterotremus]
AHGGSLYELCRKVPLCYTDRSRPQNPQEPVSNPSNLSCFTPNLPDSKTVAKMSRLSPQSIRCNLPPESYIVEVMRKVLQALHYMHRQLNLVHLDIKAENILLRQPYPSTDVFIIDFGLATVLTEGRQHRELAGTPDYVAPEIINYDPISFATDMWSVGVLTYFLLTGVSPFLASEKELTMQNITHGAIEFPAELFEHRSSASVDFLRGLLVRKPEQRMTAEQCLRHEWLQTTYAAENTTPAWSSVENNMSSTEQFKEADIDSGSKLLHLYVKPLELLSSVQSIPLNPTLFSRSDYEPNSIISKDVVNRLFSQQGDYIVRLGLVTELIPLRSIDLCKIQMYIQALFPMHSLPIHHVYMEPSQPGRTHVMSCGAPTGSRVPAQYKLPSLLSSKHIERSLSNRRSKSEISITVIPSQCPLMSRITDQSTSLLIHLKGYQCTSKNSPKPNHSRVTSSYGDHHTTSLSQNSAMLHSPTADYPPFSLCSPYASCACVYETSLDDHVTSVHFPPNCNVRSEPDTWHRQHHRLANLDSLGSQTQLSRQVHINKGTSLPGLEPIIRLFYNLHAVCRVVWHFFYSAFPSNLITRLSN